MATQALLVPTDVADVLPSMVRNELSRLDAQKQEEFVEEFDRKSKSIPTAYLCWFLFGFHYAYQGKWGMQVLYWLTAGGLGVWALVDLFRIPGMIRNYNADVATGVMRNLKALSA